MSEIENKAIVLNGLTKSYGEKRVLDNFSASFPYGSKTVIKGVSGCGKTTLLRIIAGLTLPDSGTVTGTADKKISVLFQEDRLFPTLTALGNVAAVIQDGNRKKIAADILGMLGLGDKKDLDSYPSQLSGGMKRRCAIARALAYDGDIVLLDEALKGLDRDNAEKCAQVIRTFTENKTVISVTHLATSLEDDFENTLIMTSPEI